MIMLQMIWIMINLCFFLTILEKNQRKKTFSGESATVLKKIANYKEAKVKLRTTQLSKLKSTAKNKTEKNLRLNKKNFQNEELPDKLFLKTRQTTKIRNAIAQNLSTDIKLSKTQISKIIQSGGSFGS